jgi:hypothetical protein
MATEDFIIKPMLEFTETLNKVITQAISFDVIYNRISNLKPTFVIAKRAKEKNLNNSYNYLKLSIL